MPGTTDVGRVAILRLALLLGAGFLGAIVGFTRPQTTPYGAPPALTTIGRVVWAIAIVACLLLALRARRDRDPSRLLATSIVGWGFAELTTVFGAAYWYLVGSSEWYFAGLGFLALTLFALPGVPRRS